MKHLLLSLLGVFIMLTSIAQHQNSFNYQAILRDADGKIMADKNLLIRASILMNNEDGRLVYSEEFKQATSPLGLINLKIGEGSVGDGTFSEIQWGKDQYFLKIEIKSDADGFITFGTSPFSSVPYAMHAQTVTDKNDADANPTNEIQTLSIEGNTIRLSDGGSVDLPTVATFSGNYDDLNNKPTLTGDVSGELNSTKVEKIQGKTVSTNLPSNGQVLKWDAETESWIPGEDELGEAGTNDGVAESISVSEGAIKTITLNRSNNLDALTANFYDDVNDADADAENELQNLSIENDSIKISDGTGIPLPVSTSLWQSDGTNVFLPSGNLGVGSATPSGKLEVKGNYIDTPDDILFSVVNNEGDTVFAVYQGGVRINVDNSASKAARGGFAVASRSAAKGVTTDILNVSSDSVRIYLDDTPSKAARGGFAVASRSAAKGVTNNIFNVSSDSVRIYLDENPSKAARGGFAVASRSAAKGDINQDILNISGDSVRIYLDDTPTKAARGGFAVASRSAAKGTDNAIFKLSTESEVEVTENASRILFYPTKDAFLAGTLKVEHADSVGQNSANIGYQNIAKGQYSQAFGYQSIARGNYSMAVGKNALAAEINSFAFGEDSKANSEESYAFGRGAIANGYRSFAFGSAGVDSAGVETGVAQAKGDYSFAIGQGSITGIDFEDCPTVNPKLGLTQQEFYDIYYSGTGAIAIGVGDSSLASYATTIGYYNTANYGAVALGYNNKAYSSYSTVSGGSTNITTGSSSVIAGGKNNTSHASYSAISGGIKNTIGSDAAWGFIGGGYNNEVNGSTSSILNGTYNVTTGGLSAVLSGSHNNAYSYCETVIGRNNAFNSSGDPSAWQSTDHLFVIGNGFSDSFRSNALVVYKSGDMDINGEARVNGNLGIYTSQPATSLHVNHSDDVKDGLTISNKASSNRWHFHVNSSNSNLELYFNDAWMGAFNAEMGNYESEMPYKSSNSTENVVTKDVLEQQKVIEDQEKRISNLEEELATLKKMVLKLNK